MSTNEHETNEINKNSSIQLNFDRSCLKKEEIENNVLNDFNGIEVVAYNSSTLEKEFFEQVGNSSLVRITTISKVLHVRSSFYILELVVPLCYHRHVLRRPPRELTLLAKSFNGLHQARWTNQDLN